MAALKVKVSGDAIDATDATDATAESLSHASRAPCGLSVVSVWSQCDLSPGANGAGAKMQRPLATVEF